MLLVTYYVTSIPRCASWSDGKCESHEAGCRLISAEIAGADVPELWMHQVGVVAFFQKPTSGLGNPVARRQLHGVARHQEMRFAQSTFHWQMSDDFEYTPLGIFP